MPNLFLYCMDDGSHGPPNYEWQCLRCSSVNVKYSSPQSSYSLQSESQRRVPQCFCQVPLDIHPQRVISKSPSINPDGIFKTTFLLSCGTNPWLQRRQRGRVQILHVFATSDSTLLLPKAGAQNGQRKGEKYSLKFSSFNLCTIGRKSP